MLAPPSLRGCGIDVRVTSRRSFLSLRLNYAGVVSRKGKFITTLSSPLPYKDTQIFRAITSERGGDVRRGVARFERAKTNTAVGSRPAFPGVVMDLLQPMAIMSHLLILIASFFH